MSIVNLLILAGAGTSIELGVPGMAGLAEEFIEHTRQWDVEPELVQRILESTLDIEHLIEQVDHIYTARRSLEKIGDPSAEFRRYDKVRAEIEWFIQHAAERILPRNAHLMWGAVLRAADRVNLTLITTNYDRAIELAANAEHIQLDDGFGTFDQREAATWRGIQRDVSGITLVKLHGSTDWYSDSVTGRPTKLRHPMPLFGRGHLRLPDGSELGSALILPSREKLLTRDPYPRLSQAFLNAGDACDVAVVIGSSLRDHHLRGAAQSIANRVPLFVVNPNGDACGIGNAIPIAQSAGTFLVSTLPAAIMNSDPAGVLRDASKLEVQPLSNCLAALRVALDQDQSAVARCSALEDLDAQEARLDTEWMQALLDCSDAQVARYALGLIPHSPTSDALIDVARNAPHAANNAAYQEDLALLEAMLST